MPFPRSGRAVQRLSAAAMSALLLASAMKHFRDPGFFRQVVPGYLCLDDTERQETSGDVAAANSVITSTAAPTPNGAATSIAAAIPNGAAMPKGAAEPGHRRPLAVMTRDEWIAVSGLLELAAAVGILIPLTRKATATALTAMFVAFLAGHADALQQAYGPQGTSAQRKAHTMRFPLQAPLILWAWSLRQPVLGAGK
jgi:uncharacterized membrane protein